MNIDAITRACRDISEYRIGALILITRDSLLDTYSETGCISVAEHGDIICLSGANELRAKLSEIVSGN
ncbi:MAG: hypothetical protein LBH91_05700 [Prevotellaceae bacterium]|jgi:DNA integrity scanning protein DisA with diadenylate cyclase activity|nr:hypothetical protein [Prevotellaceae bacterium]